MDHYVLKNKRTTLERAEKFISTHHFTDINLTSKLYPKKVPVTSIIHYKAPDRISYKEALKGKFTNATVGQSFGPTWSTHWFCVDINIPSEWQGEEVHLLWDARSEATVWVNGKIAQGLSGENKRISFSLSNGVFNGKLKQKIYVEMACNDLLGCGDNGMINAPNPTREFTLTQAEIAVFDRNIYNLLLDIEMLHDIAKHLPDTTERGFQALYVVNQIVNTCDVEDKDTYEKAHQIAVEFFKQKNGSSQHTIHAMGHAHIDTAWLWPYAETIRKCARSWSCSLRLMEKHPEFKFTCSQAQQYEWIKEYYPDLYQKITHFVKQGQFVPVGGTWVEMDGNLPSGESFVRQFLYGQLYFKKEFGKTCKEFWLPDTFGYSAQLPQIMQYCDISRFLTQKMSWNLVNKFPHHTFWWEGIDGSKVLSHFPPGDSYGMQGHVKEVLYSLSNYKDKGRSGRSVFLFGFGDGGNGPSEDMLERLDRIRDTDGLPKVKMSTPDEYFNEVEAQDGDKLCRWRGELYLELHNGTYTSQANVKKMNRKCEFLLHDVEFIASMALVQSLGNKGHFKYPAAELLRLWKLVLLNQFHDVLPGSSIGMVYEDSDKHYEDITSSGNKLWREISQTLVCENSSPTHSSKPFVFNTLGWDRTRIVSVEVPAEPTKKKAKTDSVVSQISSTGNTLYKITVPKYGYCELKPLECKYPVTVEKQGNLICMENEYIKASVDSCGRVVQLFVQGSDRNIVSADNACNQFVMYEDVPLYWDAWDVMDYHMETRKPVENILSPAVIVEKGPLRAQIQFSLKISEKSHLKQTISLDACTPYLSCETEVVWHENRKFLKAEFPTTINAMQATYEIQFGHLQRPNHFNTSWDWARFEVCGHKWADLSEFDFGLAVLNDCKYGYSCLDSVLRLSLLRSPKAPDAEADMGTHHFTYAIMPHTGTLQKAGVVQQAYNLNCPLYIQSMNVTDSCTPLQSYFNVDNPQVILETIKKAEGSDDHLVLRFYEAYGGHTSATLITAFDIKNACWCNGLEDPYQNGDLQKPLVTNHNMIQFNMKPFQILSLLVEI